MTGFPPNGFEQIVETYGDPRWYVNNEVAWQAKILTSIAAPESLLFFAGHPVKSVRCHMRAAIAFDAALSGLAGRGITALEYGGTYAFRVKRTDTTRISTHSWGIAIDLNETRCPLGSDPALQDRRIVEAFKAAGFTWGGDFHGTKDPMHFQLCGGY